MCKPWISLVFILLFSVTSLSGCLEKDNKVKADRSSPEYSATMFFYAVLADKDKDKAKQYSSDKIDRLLDSYGSTSNFSRHLLNMRFDTVTVEVESTSNLREVYSGNSATITMLFTGLLNGNKVDDFRKVKLVKEGGQWLVEEIKADPFAR